MTGTQDTAAPREAEADTPSPSPEAAAAALLAGFLLLMLGNGLQATLIGVRTQTEGFSSTSTTLIMTGYFAGFILGSKLVVSALGRVGHIRAYAALASLASTAALIHAVEVSPVVWVGMRFLTGVCMAGLYIVAESWLNDITTNATRGRLLGAYQVVTMGGFAGGNLLLGQGDPNKVTLFVAASVLCSLSLVPISLSTTSAPAVMMPEPMGMMELARLVPTGVIAGVTIGFIHGAFMGMAAVYASRSGLDPGEVARFLFAPMAGAVLFQYPLGLLSDRVSRRLLMLAVTGSAMGLCLVLAATGPQGSSALLLMLFLGGLIFPLYSLTLAYVNDWMPKAKVVSGSASFVTLGALGAVAGPLVVGLTMSWLGNDSFFYTLAVAHGLLGVYLIWRLAFGDVLPENRKGRWVPIGSRSSVVVAALLGRTHRNRRDSQ